MVRWSDLVPLTLSPNRRPYKGSCARSRRTVHGRPHGIHRRARADVQGPTVRVATGKGWSLPPRRRPSSRPSGSKTWAPGGGGAWAVIGLVQAVGSLGGGKLALRWRPQRPLLAALGTGLFMVPYLVVFAAGGPLWLVAGLALAVGAQGALYITLQSTTIHQRIPDAERSRVGRLVPAWQSRAAAGEPDCRRAGGRGAGPADGAHRRGGVAVRVDAAGYDHTRSGPARVAYSRDRSTNPSVPAWVVVEAAPPSNPVSPGTGPSGARSRAA